MTATCLVALAVRTLVSSWQKPAGSTQAKRGGVAHSPQSTAVGICRIAGMAARQAATPSDCSSPDTRCSATWTATTLSPLSSSSSSTELPGGTPLFPGSSPLPVAEPAAHVHAAWAAMHAAARSALPLPVGSRACLDGEACTWPLVRPPLPRTSGLLPWLPPCAASLLPAFPLGGAPAAAAAVRCAAGGPSAAAGLPPVGSCPTCTRGTERVLLRFLPLTAASALVCIGLWGSTPFTGGRPSRPQASVMNPAGQGVRGAGWGARGLARHRGHPWAVKRGSCKEARTAAGSPLPAAAWAHASSSARPHDRVASASGTGQGQAVGLGHGGQPSPHPKA